MLITHNSWQIWLLYCICRVGGTLHVSTKHIGLHSICTFFLMLTYSWLYNVVLDSKSRLPSFHHFRVQVLTFVYACLLDILVDSFGLSTEKRKGICDQEEQRLCCSSGQLCAEYYQGLQHTSNHCQRRRSGTQQGQRRRQGPWEQEDIQ